MKILTTLFLLFLSISQTYAETKDSPEENLKEYDIEIIIFEDAHARYINSEVWPQNVVDETETLADTNTITNIAVANLTDNLKEPNLTKAQTRIYKTIKPVILGKEYQRINGSSEYNVLFYGAWRQPGLEESRAFEINLNELDNAHNSTSENSITGHLKVVLARYLHFYSELEYQRQGDKDKTNGISADHAPDISPPDITAKNLSLDVNNTDVLTTDNNIYPLKDHRRMRSKELHYIDHPLIGMLIQINTVEKP